MSDQSRKFESDTTESDWDLGGFSIPSRYKDLLKKWAGEEKSKEEVKLY